MNVPFIQPMQAQKIRKVFTFAHWLHVLNHKVSFVNVWERSTADLIRHGDCDRPLADMSNDGRVRIRKGKYVFYFGRPLPK